MPVFRIALIRKLFVHGDGDASLGAELKAAAAAGAQLAVFPELQSDAWYPATKEATASEVCRGSLAEEPRVAELQKAAAEAGIAAVGTFIVASESHAEAARDDGAAAAAEGEARGGGAAEGDGERLGVQPAHRIADVTPPSLSGVFNTALAFNKEGVLVAKHEKQHLPCEEGFWEPYHYSASPRAPDVIDDLVPGLTLAVQPCSDLMRPQAAMALSALGASVILHPRATEAATSARWEAALVGVAIASAAYVLSVPRPSPERGVDLGGPVIAVSPTGEVLLRSTAGLETLDVDTAAVAAARRGGYPGYLDTRADVYRDLWARVARRQREAERAAGGGEGGEGGGGAGAGGP